MKLLFAGVLLAAGICSAQQDCPLHAQHTQEAAHQAGVDGRGDHAMGFSHEKTTHHFRLAKDGGSIEVETNEAKDTTSRDQIREHLGHIAKLFADGNFEIPMLVHDKVPPGVPVMKRFKEEIGYKYETTEKGGAVRIVTKNAEAVAAVHEFLKFQITDHRTGDPLEIR